MYCCAMQDFYRGACIALRCSFVADNTTFVYHASGVAALSTTRGKHADVRVRPTP